MDGVLLGSGVGLASGAGFLAWAVRGRSAQVLATSAWRGDPARRTIALTFDDGPSESTPALLEILAEHRVKATFFMVGHNVRRLGRIAKEVAAQGHQLGNHGDLHQRYDFHSRHYIAEDIRRAQKSIYRNTGVAPSWFRPPYGVRWFGLNSAQKQMQLAGVMWTTMANDWCWSAPRVSRLLLGKASNGTIFCLHDGRELQKAPDIRATLDAVEYVIPRLQEQGYTFETVSEILCATPTRLKMPFDV
jgi:peptidoglycan/xylan/chitin deacetylase (PgdA/CDA1 family)